jgi:TetR/AcrR family transcriptional repressor of nem operon
MGRPRSFDEREVLQASCDQFRAGYHATSIDDLTTATGLGKGSLYGAFGDKHQLYLRVLGQYCSARIDDAQAALSRSDGTAVKRITDYVMHVASPDRPSTKVSCLMASSAAELASTDPEVTVQLQRTYHRLEELLTEAVTDAQSNGEISPDADPKKLGRMLLGVQRGMEALATAGADTATLRDIGESALAGLPR